jgi:nicotinate-nucleotide pyrophosphorylase (carboxylating)
MADGLPQFLVYRAVAAALEEDLGPAGDITTNATIDETARGKVAIVAREPGVIAGLQFAEASFKTFDHGIDFKIITGDGGNIAAAGVVATIEGHVRALLTGERVALNYLGHLSGIATLTSAFAQAIAGTGSQVCCTRKTTPHLRAFEKYAVRMGGGANHRFTLSDVMLIKDNHIAACGGIAEAIERARAHAGHMIKVEVEVDTIDQLRLALEHDIDAVLLDNMDVSTLSESVKMARGRVVLEASGGMTLETVNAIAETGVDLISVGALTHSAPVLDLGLDWS